MAEAPPGFTLRRFSDLPGWRDDDFQPAFEAFRRSAFRVLEKPYRSGSLGIAFESFQPAFAAARAQGVRSAGEARAFFEGFFRPAWAAPDGGQAKGFVTGFYEPEAEASPERTPDFPVPLYRPPPELVEIDGESRPPGLDPAFRFARRTPHGFEELWDRRAIETGVLAGRGLELAWLKSKVDAFFIHVQGAARLLMPGGRTVRVTYAAKSGHPFTGIGKVLADMGEIPLAAVTMQSIRAWLAQNPEGVDELLWRNRSFIFFREAPVDEPALGPVAAAKVPLTAGRSVAVDRLLHTFGTPFFIHAPELTAFDGKPFRRLMIAQDTGSAILGPARGDLFAGSGLAAGEIAGVVRHRADFFALLPKTLLDEQS
ncbi:MAG TPA: murein transglycosylase A [Mesorhizobium sp.]|jgi:membrane-bound lytic murein transglycosylase A|nr:murein transglycosylase A [Mesorhizobium sp.]